VRPLGRGSGPGFPHGEVSGLTVVSTFSAELDSKPALLFQVPPPLPSALAAQRADRSSLTLV